MSKSEYYDNHRFNGVKHFRQLLSRCHEARVRLLERGNSTEYWVRACKESLREMDAKDVERMEYHLHTHMVPKGGVLYINQYGR